MKKGDLKDKRPRPAVAEIVQKLDSALHRINHYPAEKYYGNQFAIRWIVMYPVDGTIQRLNYRGQDFRQFRFWSRDDGCVVR